MPLAYLGIDIAKDTYQTTLLLKNKRLRHEFMNAPSEFGRLRNWLRKHRVREVHVCMEATGRYGDDLALYLHEAGYQVSVVNPMRIKAYAQSQLTRNKTDRVDADLIAQFCQTQQPCPWTPPAPEVLELRELLHHYDTLQTQKVQVQNRRQSGVKSPIVRQDLENQLVLLEQQLANLKQQIADHLDQHPDLKHQADLLDSIPGIGLLTAAKLVAEDPLRFETARTFAAYAGVTPRNGFSGTSVHQRPRMSKLGDAELRRSVYLPAVAAYRCNPFIQALRTRLTKRGKCKMAIIGAAMHKLLRLAFGVLKSNQPFDPNFSHLHFAP